MTPVNRRLHVCLAILFLMPALPAAWAQNAAEPLSPLDRLELAVEIDRHERLIKVRKSTEATLAPFASDGCSGGLSAAWAFVSSTLPAIARHHGNHPPWERCCVAHDRLYHQGGPPDADAKTSFEARRAADEDSACVRDAG